MGSIAESCFDPRVALAELSAPRYDAAPAEDEDQIGSALGRLARALDWSAEGGGAFGRVIPRGARVLIKPNFVLHQNQGPWGMEPLITHQSLIRAAVEEALSAEPAEVVVGDAPLQACDYAQLLRATGLDEWAGALMKRDARFKGIRDFRRTTCVFVDGVRVPAEDLQPEENFVLFDLGDESLLEPITDGSDSFRVTCYDPRLLARTHARGRHQYLVAREIIEADVIINLPKLKTHMKTGITCALKNLIGINGNKEYLPHHRIGGAELGGDCYPGASPVKRVLEYVYDQQNTTTSPSRAKLLSRLAVNIDRVARRMGDRVGVEGAWSGNDTIWRTGLDLNRILLYGRPDASFGEEPQRRVIHLVDAVVAGQGNGPLAPQPLPLKLTLAGQNAAAVDWVGAQLLGYDAQRIAICREAFGQFRWPLTRFTHRDVTLVGDLGEGIADELLQERACSVSVSYPPGWSDAALRRDGHHGKSAAFIPGGLSEG